MSLVAHFSKKNCDKCSKKGGIRLAIEPPAKAPKSVADIRANDEPINTAKGLLVVLLRVIVVN